MLHDIYGQSLFIGSDLKLKMRVWTYSFIRNPRFLINALLLTLPWSVLMAGETYIPSRGDRISEIRRWTELEQLRGREIYCADTDEAGTLWLGGKSGITAYDGLHTFDYPFPKNNDFVNGVRSIFCASNGIKYMLSGSALKSFGAMKEWSHLLEIDHLDTRSTVFAESKEGHVWFASPLGLFRIKGDHFQKMEQINFPVLGVCIDSSNRLWVSNGDGAVIRVYEISGSEVPELRLVGTIPTRNSDYVRLYPFSDGGIIASYGSNRSEILQITGLFKKRSMKIPSELDDSRPFQVLSPVEGEIVIIQSSLLAYYKSEQWIILNIEEYPLPPTGAFLESLVNNQLFLGGKLARNFLIDLSDIRLSVYENLSFQVDDSQGVYWFIEKDRRICVYNEKTSEWVAYGSIDGIIDSPNRIYISEDSTVWVSGSHNGRAAVSFFDEGSWHLHEYPKIGSTFSHLAVIEMPDGTIVFGNGSVANPEGDRPGGLVVYRKEKQHYAGEALLAPLYLQRPATMVNLKGDSIWMGGFAILHSSLNNPLGMIRDDQIQTGWVDHLAVDSELNLWAAVWGEGVHRFDGTNWVTFGISDGLVSNETIFVLPGKILKGTWVATREGISRYDRTSWSKRVFEEPVTLQREGGTLAESSRGDLWINSSHRDWLLNLDADPRNSEAPHKTIRYRPDQCPPDTELIKFENQIREPANAFFEWKGADFWNDTPSEMLEFSYRLSGGEWGPFASTTQVSLLDLAAGDYMFEVRARDRDWNIDPTPATVSFEVIPPLWKQLWFILTVLFATCGFVVLVTIIVRMRLRHIIALREFKLDFFTNLSHELRTPLTVILGPLESMAKDAGDSTVDQRTFEMVLRNARKMLGLVNQLLEFRKVELGKLSFHPAEGEIIGFLKDSVYSLAPLWEKKQQEVEIRGQLKAFRCGFDPDKLQRMVDNLLSNAIKYTQQGGRIFVNVEIREKHSFWLHLAVSDNGIGIPKSKLDHIMDPFYQVQTSGKGEHGSGIGLALVKELVDLWGGSIKVESEQDGEQRGTVVSITLPLLRLRKTIDQPTSSVTESEADVLQSEEFTGITIREKPIILVVEDNEDLRVFIRDELSRKFDVVTAENGLIGLDTALEIYPDLIVTDVMMPEMDGIEFCSKIREHTETSHIPIIILTARSADEHYLQGIDKGADEFFGKPVKVEILVARIENLLQSRKLLRESFSNPQQLVIEPSAVAVVSSDQTLLQTAIDIVEANFESESFDVETFAREMAMSRATLFRKLKAITDLSPGDFIRSLRLKRAAQLLQSTDLSISQIIDKTGFYDASNFSRSFKKEFSITPSRYRVMHKD